MTSHRPPSFEGVQSLDPHDYEGRRAYLSSVYRGCEKLINLLGGSPNVYSTPARNCKNQMDCSIRQNADADLVAIPALKAILRINRMLELQHNASIQPIGTPRAASGDTTTTKFIDWTLAQGIPVVGEIVREIAKLRVVASAMVLAYGDLSTEYFDGLQAIYNNIGQRIVRLMTHACLGDWEDDPNERRAQSNAAATEH